MIAELEHVLSSPYMIATSRGPGSEARHYKMISFVVGRGEKPVLTMRRRSSGGSLGKRVNFWSGTEIMSDLVDMSANFCYLISEVIEI